MAEKDYYFTVNKKARSEIKIKGSKFIASVTNVSTKEAAEDFIRQISAEFHDATHNCFAYRIGESGLEFRYSDDGEPSGSAGKPILFSLNKFSVSDTAVVVTRYYGGTKLGVGGLARAYSDAANEALEQAGKKKLHITVPVQVFCTYEDISSVKKLIDEYAFTFDENYAAAVEFIAKIPASKVEEFRDKVTQATAARAGTKLMKK